MEKLTIIVLDTEGFYANNVTEEYDAKIFAVTTLCYINPNRWFGLHILTFISHLIGDNNANNNILTQNDNLEGFYDQAIILRCFEREKDFRPKTKEVQLI